ncbi:MAG TPA: hypothetical protein DFR83_09550 [Deltaproteobacteria bacterium]|nr:hypothetical protein [Deltaproteobacteria bacterium]
MSRIVFALFPFVSLAACHEPKCVQETCSVDAIDAVRVESDRIVLELAEGERRYHLSCQTEVITLARQDPSGGITPIDTDHQRIADRFEGYWLDGEFQYPSFDEGCDVITCMELDAEPAIGRTEFAVVGTDAPPEDLQSYIDEYGWDQEAPDSVSVVESIGIEGSIEIRLAYHSTPDCSDAERFDTALIEL